MDPGLSHIFIAKMCKVRRASAVLLICIIQLVQLCRAAPEVSVGSVRTSASKPLVNWRPSYEGLSIGGPAFNALLGPSEKRTRAYNFGLGKKSVLSDVMEEMDGAEEGSDNGSIWKRVSGSGAKGIRGSGRIRNGYSFGLGKRGWLSSITPVSSPYYGDIKRRYSFGLGKRSVASQESAAADDLLSSGNK